MKKFFILIFLSFFCFVKASSENIPFNKSQIKKSFEIDNGNIIIIEQFERGDRIWEMDTKNNNYKNISRVWNFIALAKNCESVKEKNIYFAQNLEYWLGGGAIIDNAQIRIFKLNDPSPWRDSDLGIVPNMKWAKQHCTFYSESN